MKTKGWQKVFTFTFLQYVKTKTFIVGTIIVCIISATLCVLTNVLPGFLLGYGPGRGNGGDTGDTKNETFMDTGTVYLFDEAEILTADEKDMLAELFGDRYREPDSSLEDVVTELKTSEGIEAAVRITVNTDNDGIVIGYEVKSYYAPNAKSYVDSLGGVMSELVNRRIMLNAGVLPEHYADTKLYVSTSKTEAGGKNLNSIQSMVNYAIPFVVSIVLFMLIFVYGQTVAQSIATEKTSRVMELLLTSVRPLAVVIGKVLAMGLVSFLQFFLIVAMGALGFIVSAPFGWLSQATELLNNPDIQTALSQAGQSGGFGGMSLAGVSSSELELAQTLNDLSKVITPINIIFIVLIFLLGFIFYSLIAALIGASVSRMEDLQAAMSPYSLVGVLGFYLAYFPVIFSTDAIMSGDASTNTVQMFSYFFPISSPFALPSAVMLGTMEQWQVILGIAVLIAAVVLVAMLVGKVYEAIILHNGKRIKFGDILKMAVRR